MPETYLRLPNAFTRFVIATPDCLQLFRKPHPCKLSPRPFRRPESCVSCAWTSSGMLVAFNFGGPHRAEEQRLPGLWCPFAGRELQWRLVTDLEQELVKVAKTAETTTRREASSFECCLTRRFHSRMSNRTLRPRAVLATDTVTQSEIPDIAAKLSVSLGEPERFPNTRGLNFPTCLLAG